MSNVTNIVYYRYMFFVKTEFGDEAEIMLEVVLKNGYITASKTIIETYKRLEQLPSTCKLIQMSLYQK